LNLESLSIQIILGKNDLSTLNIDHSLQRGSISLSSSPCDLIASSGQCDSKPVYQQIIVNPLALNGFNGNDQANINSSSLIGLVFLMKIIKKYDVKNLKNQIKFVIEKSIDSTAS